MEVPQRFPVRFKDFMGNWFPGSMKYTFTQVMYRRIMLFVPLLSFCSVSDQIGSLFITICIVIVSSCSTCSNNVGALGNLSINQKKRISCFILVSLKWAGLRVQSCQEAIHVFYRDNFWSKHNACAT